MLQAQTAHQTVEEVTERLFADLNANRDLYRQQPQAFYDAMDRLIGSYVDVDGVSRSVMTVRYSRRATAEQMQRFQDNFKRGLMQFYGNALLEYDNRGVRVLPPVTAEGAERAEVRMEVAGSGGAVHPVSYTMVKIGNEWKLRNVIIEGINLGKLFRDQFAESMQRNRNNLDAVIDGWVDSVSRVRQPGAAK
ncbi:MAG: ABC transporter substrate-binding protein [Thiopseudomonas sp.]